MTRTLLLVAVLISGCASSRLPTSSMTRLDEVNALLAGQPATLVLRDGQEYRASNIEIACEQATFESPRVALFNLNPAPESVSTSEIDRIEMRVASGRGKGGMIGAAPGGILIALGAFAAAVEDCEETSTSYCGYGPVLLIGGGALLLLTGAAVGSTVGGLTKRGQRLTVDSNLLDRLEVSSCADLTGVMSP